MSHTSTASEFRVALFAAMLMATVTPNAQGTDIRWNNPAGGVFQTPANWQGGLVPTALDTAIFEDSHLVHPKWRPHMLATVSYYLCSSTLPDSPVMQRAKEAIRSI